MELVILVGLPASGKSYYSNQKIDEGYHVISSDDLREELTNDIGNQDENDKVFAEMYSRAKQKLKEGFNVVLDSTNISAKRRRNVINEFRKHANKITAVYFNTPYETCLVRNSARGRVVPKHVIERMYKQLEIPTLAEGFDAIHVRDYKSVNLFAKTLRDVLDKQITTPQSFDDLFDEFGSTDFKNIRNLGQDSKYHSFTVGRHTYYVWKYILENYTGEDKLVMLYAAMFHDTGKYFCKTFENRNRSEGRYANFIGHEHVSAQLAVEFLSEWGYATNFILRVVEIVQNHMKLLNIADNKKAIKKLKSKVGEDVFNKLVFFREADTSAK